MRGEVGRALFHEELLREFRAVFGEPLEPADSVRPVEKGLIPRILASPSIVARNFHNELSKFRVNITPDCIHCGLCVSACPFGVFQMPQGYNHLLPPDNCTLHRNGVRNKGILLRASMSDRCHPH